MNKHKSQAKPREFLNLAKRFRLANPTKSYIGIVSAVVEDLGLRQHPVANDLLGKLRAGQYAMAVDVADSITSQTYGDCEIHFAMNQLASFVRKVPFKDTALQPEIKAIEKFMASERKCHRINQRLRAERTCGRRRYSFLRARAQEYIKRVLGSTPDLNSIFDLCDFGPGASVGVHGHSTHVAEKLLGRMSCTPGALPYALHALWRNAQVQELFSPKRGQFHCLDFDSFRAEVMTKVDYVDYNKITCVPKTAKSHRTIAIEPLLNGFVQKGVDVFMRRRLFRTGIDLGDQTLNQRLAHLGSMGGSNPFATIDLSSASDSISIELCRDLLPPDWFTFLNRLRSPSFSMDGHCSRYEKFTSMGNGFCFPLETLIFASIVHSVYFETGDRDFAVYGDDIIVHQSSALYVIEILNYLGFSTNTDKTFIFGPFRESCGADFFEGVNVRPYTLKERPEKIEDLYKLANGLRSNPFFFLRSSWKKIVFDLCPHDLRSLRPYVGSPDSAIDSSLSDFLDSKLKRWNKDLQSYEWCELLFRAVSDQRRAPSSVEMYGLLRGSMADYHGRPEFTFRRKTRTSSRWSLAR